MNATEGGHGRELFHPLSDNHHVVDGFDVVEENMEAVYNKVGVVSTSVVVAR